MPKTMNKARTTKKSAAQKAKRKPSEAKRTFIPPTPLRPGSKSHACIEAMKRDGGVTAAELIKLTGWQPHTLRAFVSAKLRKAMALNVETKAEPQVGTVYHIVKPK